MVFEPIYIPWALNTGTAFSRVTYFILQAYTGTGVSQITHTHTHTHIHTHTHTHTHKLRRDLGEMQVNGPER